VTRVARLLLPTIVLAGAVTACSRPPGDSASTAATSSPPTATESRAAADEGKSIDALVAPDWRIEQRHDADLDGDGRPDALLVLRRGDASVPPRTLVVALGAGAPDRFAIKAQNTTIIPADAEGQIEDPLADGGIDVRPQEFDLRIALVPASGSAQTVSIRYRFRWRDGCFQLVEFRRAETNRASLDIHDTTANLITGVVTTTIGNEERNDKRTTTSRMNDLSRRCLPDVAGGFDYDPTR
jgi:hypothetical protein